MSEPNRESARRLAGLADQVGRVSGRQPWHEFLRCRLGWVEQPYTPPPYRPSGLAKAGLAALRAEHPDLWWHILGGHFNDSRQFWARVGAGVPGGYEQRNVCPHVTPGG